MIMRLLKPFRDFLRDERGVGTVFMICTLPMFLAIGGFAIDGAAAYTTRTIMQVDADAAALAAAQDLPKGTSVAIQTAITYAQKNLSVANNGNVLASSDIATGNWESKTRVFTTGGTPLNAVKVIVRRSAANGNSLPTSLLGLINVRTWDIQVQSIVTTSSAKLRVSLALDNTGSMCDPDACKGTNNKITYLKTATTQLLTKLKGAASNPKDVTVAIVPFNNTVDVGATNYGATWLTWADFDGVKPASVPLSNVGPGSNCPWTTSSNGFQCISSPVIGSATATKIPSSGTYKGYICPSLTSTYSGCYNSVGTKAPYTHTWVPYHPNFSGCVMDRDKNNDVQNTVPIAGVTATLFPAAPATTSSSYPTLTTNSNWSLNCPSKMIGATDVLDSTGWTNLTSTVTNMTAVGSTNQTIGLDWGWMLMTKGSPIVDPGDLPTGTQPILILLSDGLNTQDRWSGTGGGDKKHPEYHDTGTDARMALVCTNAKAAGVTIYTVYVDLAGATGNSKILQDCATDATKYFDLTTENQIITAFNQIGNQITKLKVVQ